LQQTFLAIPDTARVSSFCRQPDDNDHNRRLRHDSATGDPTAADAQHGDWPRKRLIRMDEKFRRAVERSIAAGDERAPSGRTGNNSCHRRPSGYPMNR
jgi:hypothetical protein